MKKNKKQIIITISLIIILILAVIGVSYAAFSYVGRGEKVNQITTGTISMDYSESDNVISINNALPTTDETGKVRLRDGEYFDFSVTTNLSGEAVINYEIAAEDFEDNTFDGSNVKFYLTKLVGSEEIEVSSNLPSVYNEQTGENKKIGRPAGMMSLLTGTTSTQGEETTNYRLRLYVDENYNPQGDGGNRIFKTRINVYGKVSTEIELPIMRNLSRQVGDAGGGSRPTRIKDDFGSGTYSSKITSIVIKKDTNIPSTALEIENGKGNYWDESELGDDSVIAYLEDDGSGNGTYKVTIGGKGGIMANTDSTFAFGEFSSLKSLDLRYLDTSNVTNMVGMFYGCSSLINLDLSNFNTSNVTDMMCMFYGCSSLEILNITVFNTSKVITFLSMFSGCESLLTLDLSNFDTSSVTDMHGMFNGCSNLVSLDLRNFDTSNVRYMDHMFEDCSSLININVSNLWTIDNAYTYGMFDGCGIDHVTVV